MQALLRCDPNSRRSPISDYLVRGPLADLDHEVYELTQLESEQQASKLILIPSESQAPLAVREAMFNELLDLFYNQHPAASPFHIGIAKLSLWISANG